MYRLIIIANDALASVLLTMADYMKDDQNNVFYMDIPTGEYSANPLLISESGRPVNSNSTFKLIMEEIEIFKNAGIVVATAAFIALHAIFNLKYRKASATIGGFEALFGLACKLKLLVKALR